MLGAADITEKDEILTETCKPDFMEFSKHQYIVLGQPVLGAPLSLQKFGQPKQGHCVVKR